MDERAASALVERSPQLERLTAAFDRVRSGRGAVALVTGEPGIGKTALVDRFVEKIAEAGGGAAGPRVLVGHCDPLVAPRALGPLQDVAERLGLDPSAELDALAGQLLASLRDGPPTVLVVEDAHWADASSAAVLGVLGRRAGRLPLLLVVTYRDAEVGSGHPLHAVVADLVSSGSTVWMGLPPLTASGVRTLAAGHDVDPVRLHGRTGGNPFFVTEALAAPDREVPESVRLAVLGRVARLGAAAREVLDVVAIVPGRADAVVVETVAGGGAAPVEECLASGVLVRGDGMLAFRHELARLAVWAQLPQERRRRLHERVLQALVRKGTEDAAHLAHHAGAAGDRPALAVWSARACLAAGVRTADAETVRHGEQALALAEHLAPQDVARVQGALARALVSVGRAEDALAPARAALEHWDRSGQEQEQADVLVVLAGAQAALGEVQEGLELVRRAVTLLERHPPGPALAAAMLRLTSAHMLARERDEAVRWGERAIALASDLDERALLGRALVETGIADVMAGRREGLVRVREAIDLGARHGLPGVVASGWSQIGSGCGELRDHATAVPALESAVAVAGEHGLEALRSYAEAWRARCELDLGRWDDAIARARGLLSTSTPLISRFVALLVTGWARARLGEPDAWPALDEAHAVAQRIGHLQRLWPVVVARAEASWLDGEVDRHARELAEVLDLARRRQHPVAVGELALWLSRAGAAVPPEPPPPGPFGPWSVGDAAGAARTFGAAGAPYEMAWALAETGTAPARAEATRVLAQLKAAPLAARLGLQLPAPVLEASARPAGLSTRELEVLRLVAVGFTNPQVASALVISRKTAEHHVSHILAKLGVTTRAEAAAAAVRLGVMD